MKKRDQSEYQKSQRSELVVLLALQKLRQAGVIYDFSHRDEPGVDFHLVLPDRCKMPLQVKSSWSGKVEHGARYPGIPCVIVRYGDRRGKIPDQNVLVENVSEGIRNCIEAFRSRKETVPR